MCLSKYSSPRPTGLHTRIIPFSNNSISPTCIIHQFEPHLCEHMANYLPPRQSLETVLCVHALSHSLVAHDPLSSLTIFCDSVPPSGDYVLVSESPKAAPRRPGTEGPACPPGLVKGPYRCATRTDLHCRHPPPRARVHAANLRSGIIRTVLLLASARARFWVPSRRSGSAFERVAL